MITTSIIKHALIAVAVMLIAAPPINAVVQTIDATVTAKVEEYGRTGLVNSDTAFEDLDDSTSNLPLIADVEFMHTDENEELAGASAITTFNDPRLSQTPDPNEFGIDVNTFSQDRKSVV